MDEFLVWVFGACCGLAIGLCIAICVDHSFRVEAAERGYAKWAIDTNGNKSWAWNELEAE